MIWLILIATWFGSLAALVAWLYFRTERVEPRRVMDDLAEIVERNQRPPMRVTQPTVHQFDRPLPVRKGV